MAGYGLCAGGIRPPRFRGTEKPAAAYGPVVQEGALSGVDRRWIDPLRSGFVENALKAAGEAYDRRLRLQRAGAGLAEVAAAVCQYFEIDASELTRPGRRAEVAQARGMIGYLSTRELSIPGIAVARRFNQDRSAVSRAAQRVGRNAELMRVARMILARFDSEKVNKEDVPLCP